MEKQNQYTEIARHSAQTKFGELTIEDLRDALKNAPVPPRTLTQKEKLIELLPEFKKQLARGHTAASLSAALSTRGLRVSARTLAKLVRPPKAAPVLPQAH